jgi:phosphoenolpyruvate carboxylase
MTVTAETLRLHRGLAVEKHRAIFQELARQLSVSGRRILPSPELTGWLAARRPFPSHVAYLEQRYAHEPYRLALALLAEDLSQASREDMLANLLSSQPHPARVRLDLLQDPLTAIQQSLPPPLNSGRILVAQRQLQIFGLHSAQLDLREDATRVNAAVSEALRGLAIHPNFEQLDGDSRLDLLRDLLSSPTPPLAPHPGFLPDTAETWSLFQLISHSRPVYGQLIFGAFIIAMTRQVADILSVLLLARWTGCDSGLQIVPLFENMDALAAAPRILNKLFHQDSYYNHLASCDNHQMVMIGYSDSNK